MMLKRPINAEQAMLPVRTVVIIVIFLMGTGITFTTTMIAATRQYDAMQQNLATLIAGNTELGKQIAELKQAIASTDYDHSRQFAQLTVRINDVARAMDSLSADEEQHKESDAGVFGGIRAGMQNLLNDIAIIKCHIPGNQCTVKQK